MIYSMLWLNALLFWLSIAAIIIIFPFWLAARIRDWFQYAPVRRAQKQREAEWSERRAAERSLPGVMRTAKNIDRLLDLWKVERQRLATVRDYRYLPKEAFDRTAGKLLTESVTTPFVNRLKAEREKEIADAKAEIEAQAFASPAGRAKRHAEAARRRDEECARELAEIHDHALSKLRSGGRPAAVT